MLHIALGVDANYIKYAGVLMTNLVHQHIGRQLCLHLALAGVTEEEKERLTQFGQLYQNVTLRVYLADNLLQELRLLLHLTCYHIQRMLTSLLKLKPLLKLF